MHITREQLVEIRENEYWAMASRFVDHQQDFYYSTLTTDMGNGENLSLVDVQHGFLSWFKYEQKDSNMKLVIMKA